MRMGSTRTTKQLFEDYSAIMVELRRREVIRSTNNPVADYAEFLICQALGLRRAPKSTKGYDATDKRGRRYEIKARRLTKENPSRQLSAIRDMDGAHFDFLAIVLFAPDFSVTHAFVIPAVQVRAAAQYRSHVNAWILHARDALLQDRGVKDITEAVRRISDAPANPAVENHERRASSTVEPKPKTRAARG